MSDENETIWKRVSDNLVLHKPSGVYYVRKSKKGKGRIFESLKTSKKGLAQTRADQRIVDWLSGGRVVNKDVTIAQICDELDELLEKEFQNGDRRAATREQDKSYFRTIRYYFGNHSVHRIDEHYWDTWILTKGKRLNRNLFDISKYLSKCLRYAYSKGYILRKPQIKNPDKPKKTGLIYENEDIERFIKHSCPLLRDLIIVGAECGLRPHENRELKWEWIEFGQDDVLIHLPASFTKTKKARSIVVSSNAATVLRRRFEDHNGPFVFPSPKSLYKPVRKEYLSKLWRKMLKESKFTQGVKFHWLRHSFFTKALFDAKLPLAEVAQYGGNSPAILMRRYVQDDPSRTKDVSKAVSLNLDVVGLKN